MSGTGDDPNTLEGELVEDGDLPATTNPPAAPEADYSEGGVPSFDFVRERIENRFTTATGATELAGLGGEDTVESLDKKLAERDEAARDKLAEIRRSMSRDKPE
jgi:phage shock protein A